MCGRFTLTCPGELLARLFGLPGPPSLAARYNIAPTQSVLALLPRGRTGVLEEARLRWGLLPAWRGGAGRAAPLINARIEGVAARPAFAASFRRRRCLIPADGFLEWSRQGGRKQPFHIRFRDRRPFAMAGIWAPDPGEEDGAPAACAILTTAAGELVAPLHARMPVILTPAGLEHWLAEHPPSPEILARLATPFPTDEMEAVPVNPRVNDARNEGPECLEEARR